MEFDDLTEEDKLKIYEILQDLKNGTNIDEKVEIEDFENDAQAVQFYEQNAHQDFTFRHGHFNEKY